MAGDDDAKKASANPDALRARIDRGETYVKVAARDRAAAPLGTDDEAAGAPLSARPIRKAQRMETAPLLPKTTPEPENGYYYRQTAFQRLAVYLIFIGVVVLFALVAAFAGFW
ncbi:MAG: hypothetical protein WBX25_34640 [Rhodomicrobium sp.]